MPIATTSISGAIIVGNTLSITDGILTTNNQTDYLSGTNELTGISNIIQLMAIWLIFIPLTLGAALQVLPSASGRYPLSQNRARLAFWMLSGGAVLGLILTLISDVTDLALADALVEDPSSLSQFKGNSINSSKHFNNASIMSRALTVFAGPAANILLSLFLFFLLVLFLFFAILNYYSVWIFFYF